MNTVLGLVTPVDFGDVPKLSLRSPEFRLAEALGLIHSISAVELQAIIERAEYRRQHRPFDAKPSCLREEACTVSLIDGATALLEIKERLDALPVHRELEI